MAQLRDALTSEFLAEGDPTALVLLAEKIGPDEVIFDGVGEHFNPDEVLRAYNENLSGLQGAAGEASSQEEEDNLAEAIDRAKEHDKTAHALVGEVRREMRKARALHEPGHEDDPVEVPDQPEALPRDRVAEPVTTEFRQGADGRPERVEEE